MNHNHKSLGFTIVELLIVIVVIGILTTIAIVSFSNVQNRARLAKSQSDLKSMQKLIELYKIDHNTYPQTIDEIGLTWFYSDNPGVNGGDAFIPGIVPVYASKLPRPAVGSYIFQSNGTDYKLMRYDAIPAGEWALVPPAMIDSFGAAWKDRYGYWTEGAAGF